MAQLVGRSSRALGLVGIAALGGLVWVVACKNNSSGGAADGTSVGGGNIGDCPVFPADNPWNQDVSGLPVDPSSDVWLASMSASTEKLHPDFGSNLEYGIPYVVVPGSQPKVPVTFDYEDESDPGPYPIPKDAPIEGGPNGDGDRHILVIDRDSCKLYETYDSHPEGAGFRCGSGAIFDLRSNALRPAGWTSADAAGLPIFPGLVRYEEAVEKGEIKHALRFTAARTQSGYVTPATHHAGSDDPKLPPMGMRVRLKASFDVTKFKGASKAVLVALKKYGMLLADNGSDWFISGASNAKWDDDDLEQLKTVPASAFEVVKLAGPIQK